METKFDELLEFPCAFPFKVVGNAHEELPANVVEVVQRHVAGDYTPTVKASSKGSYHSVTIRVTVSSKDQVEILYKELAEIEQVLRVL